MNLCIYGVRVTVHDSDPNVSLHKESIKSQTMFRNVSGEYKYIIGLCVCLYVLSELIVDKATYHDNRVFSLAQK